MKGRTPPHKRANQDRGRMVSVIFILLVGAIFMASFMGVFSSIAVTEYDVDRSTGVEVVPVSDPNSVMPTQSVETIEAGSNDQLYVTIENSLTTSVDVSLTLESTDGGEYIRFAESGTETVSQDGTLIVFSLDASEQKNIMVDVDNDADEYVETAPFSMSITTDTGSQMIRISPIEAPDVTNSTS